jgi:hypothetical protein
LASLLVTVPTAHYAFFAVIDLIATVAIIWYAWKWRNPEPPSYKSLTRIQLVLQLT